MPETSVVIRTKNEERWIGECLARLREQTYTDFEIIIVDSGSRDRTLRIAESFGVHIMRIAPEAFSYPFALNYGCQRAAAQRYFVFISGHALPISRTWLESGISDFADMKVMGVYGFVRALPDGSLWEKLFFNRWIGSFRNGLRQKKIIHKPGTGVMGFTNAIIRKDLWHEHPLDETYGAGGEDAAWAAYWFGRGFKAVRDRRFSVFHSHALGLRGLLKQRRYWESLTKPQPFFFPQFRIKHRQ